MKAKCHKLFNDSERSYQQGKRDGIGTVVGWVEKEFGYFANEGIAKIIIDDGGYYGREGSIKKWQSQKKEWGIDGD